MSDYVKVTGSPADIIGVAAVISGAASALGADLVGLLADVHRLESDAVIGGDDFATEFKKSYRQSTPAGDANVATQQAATAVAQQAVDYGSSVGSAMQDYLVTDGQGAADIGSIST